MKPIRSASLPALIFLSLALPAGTAAPAEGIAWLSDVEAARARSRAERKPIYAVFR